MSTPQKVVVVTGASQGIGAETVKAFRTLNYRIVATARSIKPSDDPNIVTVAGDIADPATAQRVISEGVTRWSTTPASSSPSRSPVIRLKTTLR
jgi:NAD(P)-dependent dehydrogenase (short-subunit alcohol dehydrogenase family)